MKLIILDAGDAYELDGYNKLLIKHPVKNKTIIELYKEYFNVDKIEIVVGYKAIEVMNTYTRFHYRYNKKWQTTTSGYSLSLAIDDEPCYVVPSDHILDQETVDLMEKYENCALIKNTENRRLSSLNASISENGFITSIYRGSSKNNDPEMLGIFKISEKRILKEWKRNCVINKNKYAGENLPILNDFPIASVTASKNTFEINTPEDYIQFLRAIKNEKY